MLCPVSTKSYFLIDPLSQHTHTHHTRLRRYACAPFIYRRAYKADGREGCRPTPRFEKFQGKLCFQDNRKFLKNLEDKKYFNTVKNFRATLFLGQAQLAQKSCVMKDIYSIQ